MRAIFYIISWSDKRLAGHRFFADLERLGYWMLVCRVGINERIDRFGRLTRAVEEGAGLYENPSSLQLSSMEQALFYGALDGPIYLALSARARSTLLVRLDALVSGGGATYDYPTITVEHVLPQTPPEDSEWMNWFPEAEARDYWTHRLGNLALLTRRKNSAASNFEFATKKSAYFARDGVSPFPLTTQVLQEEQWTPEIVKARHKYLLACLEKHWRLADRSS